MNTGQCCGAAAAIRFAQDEVRIRRHGAAVMIEDWEL
jgi:hypothetical protein